MNLGRCNTKIVVGAAALLSSLALSLPAAAPASAAGCHNAGAMPGSVSAAKASKAIACLLNKERRANGLSPVHFNRDLHKAAHRHSAYMQAHNCFEHECAGEQTLDSRLRTVGYLTSSLTRWLYGENIAYGTGSYGSPAAMVTAWMHSAGHRANILNGAFHDLGVGVVWGSLSSPTATAASTPRTSAPASNPRAA